MKAVRTQAWLIALLVASGVLGLRDADPAAQTSGPTPSAASPIGVSDRGTRRHPVTDPATTGADEGRKAQIHAIDQKIKSLRDQFKAQADPLQAQMKALRDKLDADLEPLEDQRKALVEQGESPALIALNQEEASQLASLADREKAEIEKLKQSYDVQRKEIKLEFQKRHQEVAKK
jgi:hypothetical protein